MVAGREAKNRVNVVRNLKTSYLLHACFASGFSSRIEAIQGRTQRRGTGANPKQPVPGLWHRYDCLLRGEARHWQNPATQQTCHVARLSVQDLTLQTWARDKAFTSKLLFHVSVMASQERAGSHWSVGISLVLALTPRVIHVVQPNADIRRGPMPHFFSEAGPHCAG